MTAPDIIIYTKDWCSYCRGAKDLLQRLGYHYTEVDVTSDQQRFREMVERAEGRTTVPQIFIDDAGIGGYTELSALVRSGRLQPASAG